LAKQEGSLEVYVQNKVPVLHGKICGGATALHSGVIYQNVPRQEETPQEEAPIEENEEGEEESEEPGEDEDEEDFNLLTIPKTPEEIAAEEEEARRVAEDEDDEDEDEDLEVELDESGESYDERYDGDDGEYKPKNKKAFDWDNPDADIEEFYQGRD